LRIKIRRFMQIVEEEGADNFLTLGEMAQKTGEDENTIYMRFARSSRLARKTGYQRLTVLCGRNGIVIFRKKKMWKRIDKKEKM